MDTPTPGGDHAPRRSGVIVRRLFPLFLLTIGAVSGFAGSFIQTNPTTVEMSLGAGRAKKGRITVFNPRSTETTIEVSVVDGWKQQTGKSTLSPDQWFHLKLPKQFVVPANGQRSLRYRVRAPADFQGETMAFVYFRLPPDRKGGGVGIQLGYAVPFYMAVRGTEKLTMKLDKLSAYPLGGGGWRYGVTLSSDGNVHVRPRIEVTLFNEDGLELDRTPLEHGPPIYPGRSREIYGKCALGDRAPGRYKARVDVNFAPLGGGNQTLRGEYDLLIGPAGPVFSPSAGVTKP